MEVVPKSTTSLGACRKLSEGMCLQQMPKVSVIVHAVKLLISVIYFYIILQLQDCLV